MGIEQFLMLIQYYYFYFIYLSMSYCDYCKNLPLDNVHRIYHDTQYGVDIDDDNELFGRLILEINQAGLSWDTILKKEVNFRDAYDQFQIVEVAKYDEVKIAKLLEDKGIIRNRLKINAAIYNAQQILALQNEFGSFKKWILLNNNNSKDEWVKLFKKKFKFVGGEIVNEFLMSIGQLPGAHQPNCYLNSY